MRHFITKFGPGLLLALIAISPGMAGVIDFEAQTVATGGSSTGIPDSPLSIGTATFTGGELLRGELGLSVDQTGVYATEGLFGSGETNPLVITFASPVSDFSVYVANADAAESYTISDNLGDSVTMSLASVAGQGAATFSLPGNGLTTVDVASLDVNTWGFAIDNVTFSTSTPIPEPPLLFAVGSGLALFIALRRKRRIARHERDN